MVCSWKWIWMVWASDNMDVEMKGSNTAVLVPIKWTSIGYCKKDVTHLHQQWSYIFLALTHWYMIVLTWSSWRWPGTYWCFPISRHSTHNKISFERKINFCWWFDISFCQSYDFWKWSIKSDEILMLNKICADIAFLLYYKKVLSLYDIFCEQ